MKKNSTILIVGGDDIIERSLFSYFEKNGFRSVFSSSLIGLNPTIQPSVYEFFQEYRPEYVFLGSVRSGGIDANRKYGGDFIYYNLEAQNNIIYAAYKFGTKKLMFLASSCIYPKDSLQPIKEDYLWTGRLEQTSQPYSVAKLAGIELCKAFRSQYGFNAIVAVPATVYGLGVEFDSKGHVIGALIAKFCHAVKTGEKQVIVWGTGTPLREFLHSDDFVSASIFLMDNYEAEGIVNIGCGYDVSIKELAEMIAEMTGFTGRIVFDTSMPDGVKQKLLDNSRILSLGWRPKIRLEQGIRQLLQTVMGNNYKK